MRRRETGAELLPRGVPRWLFLFCLGGHNYTDRISHTPLRVGGVRVVVPDALRGGTADGLGLPGAVDHAVIVHQVVDYRVARPGTVCCFILNILIAIINIVIRQFTPWEISYHKSI